VSDSRNESVGKFEQNNEKRIALYKQAHKLIVDDAARADVEHSISNVLVASKVKNFNANAQDSGIAGLFNAAQIELAKE
jgi:ABC-type transport system substrate-binding protein